MRVPEFAAQKYLAQVKGNIDDAEELSAGGFRAIDFKRELEKQKCLLNQFRKDFGAVRERKWKICEAAKAAGLKADYEEHYSLLSKAAHNTPAGLASKDDPRILVSSVLRLFHDTNETCRCLVFFEHNDGQPHPLTKQWVELFGPVTEMTSEYEKLSEHLNSLFNADFPK